MTEIWKDVVGYEDLYQVSNLGNVRRNGKILKQGINRGGYCCVNLSKNGKVKNVRVHTLVAQSFLVNLENYNEINHIDGNKTNNCVNNLEWVSHKDNIKHAFENNLISENGIQKCISAMKKSTSKKVLQYKNGIFIKEYDSCASATMETKITHISCCANGKRKSAGGYQWKYKDYFIL